jgi:uracil-DNA glycosylase family 4
MMDVRTAFDKALDHLRATLEQMARWGCSGFECPAETVAIVRKWAAAGQTEPSVDGSPAPIAVGPRPSTTRTADKETLDRIQKDLGDCRRCGLASGRTHIVFGEGSTDARLVFIGEGPGAEEDLSGRPFVGPAGQLLTKIIQAMHLTREQVYICNVIKCRPPGNRDPEPQEIATCKPFLLRQLAAIEPAVVCTLGNHATQTVLDCNEPVSRLRGRFHALGGFRVMPTFHPAYLLRHPERKREVWEDMKKIMALLRIPL